MILYFLKAGYNTHNGSATVVDGKLRTLQGNIVYMMKATINRCNQKPIMRRARYKYSRFFFNCSQCDPENKTYESFVVSELLRISGNISYFAG